MSAKKQKKFPFIIIAIVVFVAAIAGGYFLQVILHSGEETSNSSITKVESEDDDEKNSVNVSLKYAGYATLLSDEKLITLNFTNPSKSKKSLSLEIVANIDGEDVVLAKTDKLRPGYKIDSVKYTLDREISKGDYKGKFIVHFYNEQDKEEIVNSEITINIYVR
ncbi:hypothetical protein IJJ36_04225 [Candidatus Saccharibacteria bacterium]|nr:hypothetical protein [Candidatus Saccharibacteria bacterium]